jgi:hypothetical protein
MRRWSRKTPNEQRLAASLTGGGAIVYSMMKMFRIESKSGELLYEGGHDTLLEAVEAAAALRDLKDADLTRGNLCDKAELTRQGLLDIIGGITLCELWRDHGMDMFAFALEWRLKSIQAAAKDKRRKVSDKTVMLALFHGEDGCSLECMAADAADGTTLYTHTLGLPPIYHPLCPEWLREEIERLSAN